MLFAVGAASSAIDLLSSLASGSSHSSSKTGFKADAGSLAPIAPDGSTATTPNNGKLSPGLFNALLSAQSQNRSATSRPSEALKDLFSKIDADGDGQITKTEFETALGAGGTNLQMADDVFAKMDKNGDGSLSMDEMSSALQGAKHHHRHHVPGGVGAGDNDSLLHALDGASSSTSTNSDGSITTTLTYADGTKITMTQPAPLSSSQNAVTSYNFIERLIQRQAQAVAASGQQSLSMSV